MELIHEPLYALNKIHLEESTKLLHVSAPGCHNQGVIHNNGVQAQNVNLDNVSPLLE
jgi:hypothetical protein